MKLLSCIDAELQLERLTARCDGVNPNVKTCYEGKIPRVLQERGSLFAISFLCTT